MKKVKFAGYEWNLLEEDDKPTEEEQKEFIRKTNEMLEEGLKRYNRRRT